MRPCRPGSELSWVMLTKPSVDTDPAQMDRRRRARGRTAAAFAALFGFYAPRIKTMLMRTGASADAAEEFAQETLLSVWRKAAIFDPARSSASAWIYHDCAQSADRSAAP